MDPELELRNRPEAFMFGRLETRWSSIINVAVAQRAHMDSEVKWKGSYGIPTLTTGNIVAAVFDQVKDNSAGEHQTMLKQLRNNPSMSIKKFYKEFVKASPCHQRSMETMMARSMLLASIFIESNQKLHAVLMFLLLASNGVSYQRFPTPPGVPTSVRSLFNDIKTTLKDETHPLWFFLEHICHHRREGTPGMHAIRRLMTATQLMQATSDREHQIFSIVPLWGKTPQSLNAITTADHHTAYHTASLFGSFCDKGRTAPLYILISDDPQSEKGKKIIEHLMHNIADSGRIQ
jgi:hypothetical protein